MILLSVVSSVLEVFKERGIESMFKRERNEIS